MRRALSTVIPAVVAVVLVVSTGGAGAAERDHGTPCPGPGDTRKHAPTKCVRVNQLQVVGTHNSYHVQARPALFEALKAFSQTLADSIEYSHPPLDQQLSDERIRQFELDVFADPNGGLYANRAGLKVTNDDPASPDPAMYKPGFKVLHIQDIDFETTCTTFVSCLTTIRTWSRAHPRHVPIMIEVEVKDDAIPDPGLGFVVPLPIRGPELDALDAEMRSVFEPRELITPDDVRGDRSTLEEAVLDDGWPTLAEARGRVLFTLDNEDIHRTAYIEGHASLRGRVMFTSSPPGTPEAAFVKLNDPVGDFARIHDLVARGYLVRTRADADTKEARTGDTGPRDAAFASGAQYVSTDYPVPDPRFGTGYKVVLPGRRAARCNPVSAPKWCRNDKLEHVRG